VTTTTPKGQTNGVLANAKGFCGWAVPGNIPVPSQEIAFGSVSKEEVPLLLRFFFFFEV
jgi:hypothetical protein